MHRVVTSEVRIRLRVAQVVERYDLHLTGTLALIRRAQNVASDATVSVDAHLYCHVLTLVAK